MAHSSTSHHLTFNLLITISLQVQDTHGTALDDGRFNHTWVRVDLDGDRFGWGRVRQG